MHEANTQALAATERAIEAGIERGFHPGAQVYVSHGRRVVADFAIGEREPGRSLTKDTLMCWLSAGKPITAVAIAQLFEAGRLNLDDPVARHVPEFAAEGKDRITIRHVLTHTGGFRGVRFRFPGDGWAGIIEKICAAKPEPNWPPGGKAGYHPHAGWFMLGEIVQRLTRESISQYTRDHIFTPLGMDDSWLGMNEQAHATYRATDRLGALMDTSGAEPKPHGFHQLDQLSVPKPGGNAFGPMRELGRFYEMLLAGGQLDGPRVLEPETIELLTTPQRIGMHDHTFKRTIDWGLGVIIDSKRYLDSPDTVMPYGYGPHASPRTFGHSGWQSSAAFCDPDHELVVAMLCNGTPGEKPHYQRMHELLGAVYEDLGLA
jgi:CubicO group peptidase (beta-lactamase class C family)